jgi:hypothetical protein
MTFDQVLPELKQGKRIYRSCWTLEGVKALVSFKLIKNEKGSYVLSHGNNQLESPYLWIDNILANDWEVELNPHDEGDFEDESATNL